MADYRNIARAKAIERQNKERWLKVNPHLDDGSGIYIMTRTDEDGIRYAYVGQAVHILTRLAQHLAGHEQHIDLSLKKHKLYGPDNPTGWKVGFMSCPIEKLDEMERYHVKRCASLGFQLRNKTGGSQGEGKRQIDEYRPQKGYHDGLRQGRKNMARELSHIIDTHLTVGLKPEKANNKVSQRALEKFWGLLGEGGDGNDGNDGNGQGNDN